MDKLLFVTGNSNKIKEIKAIMDSSIDLMGLADVEWTAEIPETMDSIEGNAIQKAETVYQKLKIDCFAEDTGLEVKALNGEPGINSARYAGLERSDDANMSLLMDKLSKFEDRSARFKTVIALILKGEIHTFEGIVNGHIAMQRKGDSGFGYDPIFIPQDYSLSFAELQPQVKNQISHRAKAVALLIDFLKTI